VYLAVRSVCGAAGSSFIGDVPRLICLIPPDRADVLLSALHDHLAGEPGVVVKVERRVAGKPGGERRAPVAERDPAVLVPPELRRDVRVVQRLSPLDREYESAATSELIGAAAADEPGAVSELWWRIAPRALARLRKHLGPRADDVDAGRLLGRILDERRATAEAGSSPGSTASSIATRARSEPGAR
jgi:hypothetical protein